MAIAPNPVTALNRAVALAEVDGPAAGLAAVDGLEAPAHLLPVVRADLLARLGKVAEAAEQYAIAAQMTRNAAERDYLVTRAAALVRAQ